MKSTPYLLLLSTTVPVLSVGCADRPNGRLAGSIALWSTRSIDSVVR